MYCDMELHWCNTSHQTIHTAASDAFSAFLFVILLINIIAREGPKELAIIMQILENIIVAIVH